MKKMYACVVFVLTTLVVFGQSERNEMFITALYPYNYMSLNPAFAGVEESRITGMGSVYVPKEYRAIGGGLISAEYNAKKIKSGFGVMLSSMNTEITNNTYAMAVYNYQLSLGDESKLVFGTRFGFHRYVIDYRGQVIRTINGQYPYPDELRKFYSYTSTLGVLYKRKKLFAGFSIDNIAQTKPKAAELGVRGKRPLIHTGVIGYNFNPGGKVALTSSLNVLIPGNTFFADLNTSALIADRWIAGVSVGSNDFLDISPRVNAGIKMRNVGRIVVMIYNYDSRQRYDHKEFSGELLMQFNLD